VRVAWAGVCGSDLHVLKTGAWVSYWPATLGHEVVGVVEECPGGEVPVHHGRGGFAACPAGSAPVALRPLALHQMSWLGEARPGGFARHTVVAVTSLVTCPTHLEPAIAVLAEPLAVAMHAVSRLSAAPTMPLLSATAPSALSSTWNWCGAAWPGRVNIRTGRDRRRLGLALGALRAPSSRRQQGARRRRARAHRASAWWSTPRLPWVTDRRLRLPAQRWYRPGRRPLRGDGPLVPARVAERTLTIAGSIGFDDELGKALEVLAAAPDRYGRS